MESSRRPADALPADPKPVQPATPDPAAETVVVVTDDPVIVMEPAPISSTPPRPAASSVRAFVLEPAPILVAEPIVAPETRMLPPHQSKTERIAGHVAAISADLREWTELQIALVKRQIEGVVGILDRLQHLVEAAKMAVPGIVLILIGLLFLLLTLAFGIGALIDSVWGGFAIVTAVLLIVGGVLVYLGKKRYDEAQEAVAEAKRQERSQQSMSRDEIEDAQRRTATLSAS